MRFQDLFRGYTRSHGASKPLGTIDARGKAAFKHFTKVGPPSELEWQGHLNGEGHGLGIIPLMDDNASVCWGAIDIDQYPLDHSVLERDVGGLPLVLTKSKSGGAHLWVFLAKPASAKIVISKLSEWASALGYGKAEVFPKQHSRVSAEDVGNWINLPYYGSSRVCVYKGEELSLEDFLAYAEHKLISEEDLSRIEIISETGVKDFLDGPPCLQSIAAMGLSEGARSNGLFNVGIYFQHKTPESWQEHLKAWNKNNVVPALPENELDDTIRSLTRKPYNFTCHKHPVEQHCNRNACVKREFGIAFGSDSDELDVTLTGLTKYNTTTPKWLINIDGIRAELSDTKDLTSQARFQTITIENCHKWIKNVTPDKWHKIVQDLLDNVEIVEAPYEASPEGQFYMHLENYVELYSTEERDMLAAKKVWIDDGQAYFNSLDFYEYLRREGFRDLPKNKMFLLIHALGMERGRFNIKGRTVSWWRIPMHAIQDKPFDVPRFGEAVFGEKDKENE